MNFDQDLISEMKELAIQGYSEEPTRQFLERRPLKPLLEELLRADLNHDASFTPKITLQRILEHKFIFLALMADPDLSQVVERFALAPDEEHREFLATVVASQVDSVEEVLINNADQPESQVAVGFLKMIYFLLADREPQVGLKMAKMLVKLAPRLHADQRLDYLVAGTTSHQVLTKLLTNSEAVIEIRTFETLVQMGNANPRLIGVFEKLDYLAAGLDLYKKYFDEILEKMNIVDILSQLSSTEEGCNLLCAHPAFKAIKKEALAKDTDPFVAKSLSIMLIELVNHEKIPYSFMLFKDLRIRLEEMFMSGFGEELNACFDMIRSFGHSVEGFNLIFQTKNVLQKLCACCHSNKEGEQTKALDALGSLLSGNKRYVDTSKKGKTISLVQLNEDSRTVELILVYLANPKLVASVIDLNDEMYLKDSMTFIFDNLMMPFTEAEVCYIKILLSVLNIETVFNAFCKSARSLEYLHMKLAKTKEVFDAKNDLKDMVVHRLSHLKETVKDSFYELYHKEYKIKQEQRKQELLQYATDTG